MLVVILQNEQLLILKFYASSVAFLKHLEAFLKVAQETRVVQEPLNEPNVVSLMSRIVRNSIPE